MSEASELDFELDDREAVELGARALEEVREQLRLRHHARDSELPGQWVHLSNRLFDHGTYDFGTTPRGQLAYRLYSIARCFEAQQLTYGLTLDLPYPTHDGSESLVPLSIKHAVRYLEQALRLELDAADYGLHLWRAETLAGHEGE